MMMSRNAVVSSHSSQCVSLSQYLSITSVLNSIIGAKKTQLNNSVSLVLLVQKQVVGKCAWLKEATKLLKECNSFVARNRGI